MYKILKHTNFTNKENQQNFTKDTFWETHSKKEVKQRWQNIYMETPEADISIDIINLVKQIKPPVNRW